MMELKKREAFKITEPFTPVYNEIMLAGGVEYIAHEKLDKRVLIKWTVNHTLIYSFMCAQISFMYKMQMSLAFIGAKCNLSERTVQRVFKDLESIHILNITRSYNNGAFLPHTYDYIRDIAKDVRYRLIPNDKMKAYTKKMSDRKNRLLLLKGVVIDHTFTREQAIFLWKNRAYEERTGVFLEGDKTSGILYELDKSFTRYDELKEYEIKELEDKRDEYKQSKGYK